MLPVGRRITGTINLAHEGPGLDLYYRILNLYIIVTRS